MAGRANPGVSKLVTLIITSVAALFTSYIYSSINVALPAIGKEFAMEAVWLGWVANAAILATAAVLVPTGRLADIYGRRKSILMRYDAFYRSSFLCGISNSGILLIIYRVLQGLGAAMMIGISRLFSSRYSPPRKGEELSGYWRRQYIWGLPWGHFWVGS